MRPHTKMRERFFDVLFLFFVLTVRGETREADVLDGIVREEVLSDCLRVGAVALHAEAEGLYANEDAPGVVRTDTAPKVPQGNGPHPENERKGLKRGGQVDSPPKPAV